MTCGNMAYVYCTLTHTCTREHAHASKHTLKFMRTAGVSCFWTHMKHVSLQTNLCAYLEGSWGTLFDNLTPTLLQRELYFQLKDKDGDLTWAFATNRFRPKIILVPKNEYRKWNMSCSQKNICSEDCFEDLLLQCEILTITLPFTYYCSSVYARTLTCQSIRTMVFW